MEGGRVEGLTAVFGGTGGAELGGFWKRGLVGTFSRVMPGQKGLLF